MKIGDWSERWHAGQIGFHEGKTNSLLAAQMHLLRDKPRVLVPLAGKSKDMMALAEARHVVVGVEGVELACRQFFDDNGLVAKQNGDVFRGGPVELVCGDFFAMTPARIGTFDAAWDRAALVAVEPQERERYADVIRALLRPGARLLLVTFTYDQARAPGPPWSIDAATVRALFLKRGFVVEHLGAQDSPANARFKTAGITKLREELSLLTLTA